MKTLTTAALVAASLVAACGRDEQKPGATEPAAAPSAQSRPEMVPVGQRRIVELEGGIRVEVLAEGQGAIVAPGDHVALSMTLSYVPVAPVAATTEPALESDKKPDGAKDRAKNEKPAAKPAAVEDAGAEPSTGKSAPIEQPAGSETEAAASTAPEAPAGTQPEAPASTEPEAPASTQPEAPANTEPEAPANTEPKAPASTEPEAPASSEPEAPAGTEPEAPADTEPATPTSPGPATPASDETPPATHATTPSSEAPVAPPPPALAAPLEPIVLMSTKSAGTPLRVVVGSSSALLPGLSRALIGLRQGSIVEITLPPEAAYGAAGLPEAGVPPGTPLFATVEIREVKR